MPCKYEGCNKPVNSPHDNEYCVFHAPKENKGITDAGFNGKIFDKIFRIKKGLFNFKGYIFPGNIDFSEYAKSSKLEFNGDVDFSNAQFMGNVSFRNYKFVGKVKFINAILLYDAYFTECEFTEYASFENGKFSGKVNFFDTIFAGDAYFGDANFLQDIFLNNVRFIKNVYFVKTHFRQKSVFDRVLFEDLAFIAYITIEQSLHFLNIGFGEQARFSFSSPVFKLNTQKNIIVHFFITKFNPFAVYFENIKEINNENGKACFIFRYCQLKDVYFTNNDMSLFSFYKSSFDQARFISSKWDSQNDRILFFPFKRKNVIAEEKFFKDIRNHEGDKEYVENLKSNYIIEDLNSYEDISSLYRQMKTALDNTKDYQQAGRFYFNEFEMKRKALQEYFVKKLQEKVCISETTFNLIAHCCRKFFSKLPLYNMYKTFAGYGEKPMWSFLWFGLGVLGFTILNYCLGFKKGIILEGGTIDTLDATFWDSFIFTLYRIIPANYLPYKQIYDIPDNFWGMLIPFLNTAVLILFIAFIAIGLKRHFRRF